MLMFKYLDDKLGGNLDKWILIGVGIIVGSMFALLGFYVATYLFNLYMEAMQGP